jgi:amino acid adenylation domain-containing protein
MFASAGGRLTFGALRDGALHVAGWLKEEHGIGPGDRIAICLPKSLEAVQLIYGILCAGGCYVPLQFNGPSQRLRAILASLQPQLLVTTAEIEGQLAAEADPWGLAPIRVIEVQDDGQGLEPLLKRAPAATAIHSTRPSDLALVIFTSGTTGEPKGVMLSHASMATSMAGMQARDRMSEGDLRVSHAGLHYIASYDLFFPLLSGCRIFLLSDREAMFPERVTEVLEREAATIWSSTSTALRLLLEEGELELRDLSAMRRISFYGEPMSVVLLRRLMAVLPGTEFVNHYGATEAYNMANFTVPRPLPDDMQTVPLGRATDHCALTLCDDSGREVPPGQVGEVCVVSPIVTLGYWGDPELTAAKRIDGRHDSYRTGDLAILREDGLLHSAGREDYLVRLRGHRFDLGEIEAVLKAHAAVRNAVAFVIDLPQGGTQVGAAVLADFDPDLVGELRLSCANRLPAFARPAFIERLERFPLLSTGKVDRLALKRIFAKGGAIKR